MLAAGTASDHWQRSSHTHFRCGIRKLKAHYSDFTDHAYGRLADLYFGIKSDAGFLVVRDAQDGIAAVENFSDLPRRASDFIFSPDGRQVAIQHIYIAFVENESFQVLQVHDLRTESS